MIHFVPAWYNPTRPWYSTDSVWFQSAAAAASDDTVTQLKIFQQGEEGASLIVLNYAPSLRRFLHDQNIFDVPYWSFFDEVQGLGDDYARPLDFLELEWPDDVSFFYNPFIVTVMRGTDVYARVYLARDGTLRSIRYYGDGMPTVERIFDDRGFLSSVLMHDESGRPVTQYYLTRAGDVVVSEDIASGRVEVVQNPEGRFQSPSYESWGALMAEFLGDLLGRRADGGDTVVLAISEQHNELVASALGEQTLVLSRSAARPAAVSGALLQRAGAVFTDAAQPGEAAALPELAIYPLERRPTFGASANESTVYISVFADDISPDELDFAIASSATQLVNNEHTRLLVLSFRSQDVEYLQAVKRVIAGYQHLDLRLLESDQTTRLGVDVGIAEGPEEIIQLTFVDREEELTRTMAKTRVLVDLGATVHRRLAAAAVDAGVPQINRYQQELITHPINGFVIGDDAALPTALDHYLTGLEHWNQSLVQCRVLEDLFSAREVLGRWELIRMGVAYAGSADRP
ncbi:accessory Sec system protein Asp1 [Gryllotalpicola protaetiae]|uniref:Accessory Sec system protein Asp1 n=1 Tax=Gryllotalpicola protaetiae TaxID=2419771 RepID=A0A387BW89_9MICO|nr:accessory Sec system protein Asp1 [Gryllotalpicola protaetiae]AYG05169.1 accessory Sec system protein Asp1 [Gryllotalpicola protaetiae]